MTKSVKNIPLEPVTGHYLSLETDGLEHRIYFETAGAGIPLLCLHTAGADGRQYRAIANDMEILKNFKVIVPDMPWHGKSSPPEGWQNMDYQLTTDKYVNFVLDFMSALNISMPVIMGCSIGGRVVLHLALKQARDIKAVIGLQSGLHAGDDQNSAETLDYLHRHDIHGGEAAASAVSGLMAPNTLKAGAGHTSAGHTSTGHSSTEKHRWETLWHYASGGPGVFKGDLHYYFQDGDLRNDALEIDTSVCPVYFLSGEYDYSAPPESAWEIHQRVKGSYFQKMSGLGHFPMSENPDRFKTYLMPVLEMILAESS